FSSKNYARKFLRALHPKWRAKVTAIEESKDLSSLALDELIRNLKVHEVVMEKDFKIYKGKKERIKSIILKANKESSDDETSTSGSNDEEYAMANKDQKAFVEGSWSDSENEDEEKTNEETCLMAQSSNEVTLNSSCYSDNASSLDDDNLQIEYDSLCEISLKIINKNKILKTKRDLLEKGILELNEKIKKLERSKEIEMAWKSSEEFKLENAKLQETQVKFVKFDKSANSLREMLNNQKSPSCKIGLGFDRDKASTSGTKTMSFVGLSAKKVMDGSTIKGHGSTLHGSVCLRTCLEPDEWIKDSGCSKHMTGNKSLFSTYKAYGGGDYSKPSHEGYRNTIELPVGNNVVPLLSDTIRLVQNECSFHGLRSEDPNQHLKDFLKLVDSLNLDGENKERTCLRLFQFSLRDQASNWLERLPAGSISTWEDLIVTTVT
ncbi:hypothetical protein Tco_1456171, partial [Tanacetum coccineum]